MTEIKRDFVPGGEWLYLKIYSGPKTIEQILINDLYPLISQSIDSNLIDSFFFIRFTDPEYHIRLRFHSPIPENLMKLLQILHSYFDRYKRQLLVSSIVIDTYSREIERYGANYIIDAEQLFYWDSTLICKYLSNHQLDDQKRWLTSTYVIDALLNLCNISLTDRIAFCEHASRSYNVEIFGNPSMGDKQWGMMFREKRFEMKPVLEGAIAQEDAALLNDFNCKAQTFTSKIKNYNYDEHYQLLSSIIHMHVNRMFRTKQRLNECAIYNLLYRYYKSLKNSTQQSSASL